MTVEREFQVAVDALEGMRERLAHPGELLTGPITDEVRRLFAKRFASGGAYGGDAWAPLSEETIRRRGDELNTAALIDTGILMESLTQRDTLTGFEELRDGGQTVAIGSTDPAGIYAELGTKHEPRRPVMPESVPDEDLDRMVDLVADFIVDGDLGPGLLVV